MADIFKKKIRTFLTIFALFSCFVGAQADDFVPGELLIKFKAEFHRARGTMQQLYQVFGVEKVEHFSGDFRDYDLWKIEQSDSLFEKISELNQLEWVEFAQPNYLLFLQPVSENSEIGTPVPGFSSLFCAAVGLPCKLFDETEDPDEEVIPDPMLKEPPQEMIPPQEDAKVGLLYGMKKVRAVEAWKIFRGTKSMIVADIDTGIDYNHEDLSYNIWRNPQPGPKQDIVGFDFVHEDGLPYDDAKHGTHTAGTIGAVGGNAVGVSGVSQKVSLMALKFIAASGSGTTANAIRAIDYAINHGAKILSNSWGGRKSLDNKALFDAIERVKEKGALFIAAAGNDGANNDGSQASYPAAFENENLIAVAASDKNDLLPLFSNYGKRTTHLAAPGVKILSTVPGSKYEEMSGTSMACPHVAGAAALIWAKNPKLNYREVKKILLDSVDLLPELANKTVTGGRLNVLNALRSME